MIKKISTILLTLITLVSYTSIALACNTNSADFDGTSNTLYATDSTSLSVTGDFTIELFFKNSSATGDEMSLFTKSNDAETGQVINFRILDADSFQFRVTGSGGDSALGYTSTGLFTDGNWHAIAGTYTQSDKKVRIFVGGTLVGASTLSNASTITDSTGRVCIGARVCGGTTDRWFPGFIDEVRLSNSVRYTGNYTVQTDDFVDDANTMALYHFNSDLTTDDSGNGNTLANVNSVTQSATIPYVGVCASAIIPKNELLIIFE